MAYVDGCYFLINQVKNKFVLKKERERVYADKTTQRGN